jgi:RNA-directed DNA polymerase
MKDSSKELQPALVFEETKQAGDVRSRWTWAEPAVWTDAMLTTLERGIKGGKWFSLCDKAFSLRNLAAAFAKVKTNDGAHGVDGITVSRFESRLEENLARLHRELLEGVYRPQPVRRVWIPKPGTRERRPLGVPTVRDRVVQTAVKAALEPIFEREFKEGSYGFRPGRSCHKALSQVWKSLTAGTAFVVDADLRKFFDTIPHEVILRGLKEKVSDGKLLAVVESYLTQGVMDGWTFEPDEEGTPQGSVLSPLLANIALQGLDVLAEERGFNLVRFADDFVILCKTRDEAESSLEQVKEWVETQGLSLHPEKTGIVNYGAGEGFDFLGFTFKNRSLYSRKKSVQKLRDKVREKTKRNSGKSLKAIISELNPILRGWYRYFRAGPVHQFEAEDAKVRRRLRAILDVRNHHHPAHRGATGQRWPNSYLELMGLFSMAASKRQGQSSPR